MKGILLFFAIGLANLAVPIFGDENEDNQAIMEQLFAVVGECRKSYPDVSDGRVRLLLRHESTPKNKDERCLSGCVLTRGGLVTDGKINVDAWRKMCDAKWKDKTMAQKAGDTAAYCSKRVPASKDTCRLAGSILNCIYRRDKQTGVTPPDLPQ